MVFILFCGLKNVYCQVEQDSTTLYKIETKDENMYVGYITYQDSKIVRLKTTTVGVITIDRKDISNIKLISKDRIQDRTYFYGDLHASRYLLSYNGYGLRKGNGYYQNMWIFFNQFGYGVTDNFSIGGGIIPLFLFFGGSSSPVWIVPKVSIPIVKDRLNMGAGIIAAKIMGEDTKTFGIAFGSMTYGSRNNNISIGAGYGYAGSDWATRPTISISGKARIGKKTYLMSENYFMSFSDESLTLSMVGFKSLIRKVSIDYGLIIPIYSDMEQWFAMPWLGLTVPFGSN